MRALIVFLVTAFLSLLTGKAQAFSFTCETPGYIEIFDARFTPQPCEEIGQVTLRYSGQTSTIRFLRTASDAHGDDAYWLGLAQQLADRMGPAMTDIGGLRIQPFVSVMLSPATFTLNINGSTYTAHAVTPGQGPDECQVTFYKATGEITPEQFIYSLSHELFHCISFTTHPGIVYGPDVQWWFEGTADYFASLVAPGVRSHQGWIDQFAQTSLTSRLIDMSYDAQVFFFGIANQSGPRGVGDLFHALGSAGNGDALAIAQGAISSDKWITFVEAYLNGQVTWPNGDPIAAPTNVRTSVTFPPGDRFTMETDAFRIDRIKANFDQDHHFVLTLPPATDGLTVRIRPPEGIGWTEVPETVDTCDGEQNQMIYATSVVGQAAASYAVETTDLGPGGCCLVGGWQPDQASLEALSDFGNSMGGPALAMAGGSLNCSYSGGGWTLDFYPDGRGAITYKAYGNQCTATMQGNKMKVEQTRDGATEFAWRVVKPGAAQLEFLDHSMTQTMLMRMGPVEQVMPSDYPGPATNSNGMAFKCEGDRLTVEGMFDLLSKAAGHDRIPPEE